MNQEAYRPNYSDSRWAATTHKPQRYLMVRIGNFLRKSASLISLQRCFMIDPLWGEVLSLLASAGYAMTTAATIREQCRKAKIAKLKEEKAKLAKLLTERDKLNKKPRKIWR